MGENDINKKMVGPRNLWNQHSWKIVLCIAEYLINKSKPLVFDFETRRTYKGSVKEIQDSF